MYWINARKKEYFLITPEEFSSVFNGFSFVVTNTGVKQGYTVSVAKEILHHYSELYELLASGKRCVWEEDHTMLGFTTGVTAHPENYKYVKRGKGLLIPDFKEPCVELSVFCAVPFGKTLFSKGWSITQFPQYAFGIEMMFPSKITYEDGTVVLFDQLADSTAWKEITIRIKAIAPMFHINSEGKDINTRIRVSPEAKNDLSAFNTIQERGLELL